MSFDHLFSGKKLGDYTLPHRVVMAPMTRSRAQQPGDVPQDMNAAYYGQRASAALIITEATQISHQGKGYALTPGIYSQAQIEGWKKITCTVHEKGSRIFLQIFHVGRISHSSLQPDGALPVAPSAIAAEGQVFTDEGLKNFEVPRALTTEEIPGIVEQHRQAAINAKNAGFDGVEIHAANGYLLDQFLKDGVNRRRDDYGGSIENRARLVLEVVDAVAGVWGGGKVGLRISPTGAFNSMSDSDPQSLYNYLVQAVNTYNIAYLHVVEKLGESQDIPFSFNELRRRFKGAYMANGGYTGESAENSLSGGHSDFVSFGAPFLANPDLPERIRNKEVLNEPDPSTFYGGNEVGYTDYPTLKEASKSESKKLCSTV